MRRLCITLVFLLFVVPRAQAWSGFVSASCGGAAGVTNGCSIDSRSSDLQLVTVGPYGGGGTAITVTDDAGAGAWHCVSSTVNNAKGIWLCYKSQGGDGASFHTSATHTISVTGDFIGVTFTALQGSLTSATPFINSATAGDTTVAATGGTVGPITASGGGDVDLFVTTGGTGDAAGFDSASVATGGASPYTLQVRRTYVGGTSESSQLHYITSSANTSAVWDWTPNNIKWDLVELAFKPSAGGPAASKCTLTLLGVGKC